MNYLAIDDEKLALSNLVSAIEESQPNSVIKGFTSQNKALDELKMNNFIPDVAFLDIEMPGLSGLELVKIIKELVPKTKIIFVTGFSQYALESYLLHAKGYIMKPVTAEKISDELNELKNNLALSEYNVKVKTFGNFEVYVNGDILKFSRSKSKELFAYLVSKMGAECKIREVAAVLFEDNEYDLKQLNYTQKIISSLIKAFNDSGQYNIIKKGFNSICINPEKIDCDYYNFLKFDVSAMNSYTGEFMAQYSWAEFVTGYLDRKIL